MNQKQAEIDKIVGASVKDSLSSPNKYMLPPIEVLTQIAVALVDNPESPIRSKDGFEIDLSKTRQELEVEDISIKPIDYKEEK